MDLKKHVDKDHSDAVNDKNEKYTGVKEDHSRCSESGYILYTEDINKNRVHLNFTARSAQFIEMDKQDKEKDWSNQSDCTARSHFCDIVLPVPDMSILLLTECANYRYR